MRHPIFLSKRWYFDVSRAFRGAVYCLPEKKVLASDSSSAADEVPQCEEATNRRISNGSGRVSTVAGLIFMFGAVMRWSGAVIAEALRL